VAIRNPQSSTLTEIEQLANTMLDSRELELASHLQLLMLKDNWSAAYLMRQIIPRFHENRQTLHNGRGLSFGQLVVALSQRGELTGQLSDHLARFNRIVVRPAKHFTAIDNLPRNIDERTFGVRDGTLTFVMMRHLSMQLFDCINSKGPPLPSNWKQFDEKWLTWDTEVTQEEALGDSIE
jgi:hypothetical protein